MNYWSQSPINYGPSLGGMHVFNMEEAPQSLTSNPENKYYNLSYEIHDNSVKPMLTAATLVARVVHGSVWGNDWFD